MMARAALDGKRARASAPPADADSLAPLAPLPPLAAVLADLPHASDAQLVVLAADCRRLGAQAVNGPEAFPAPREVARYAEGALRAAEAELDLRSRRPSTTKLATDATLPTGLWDPSPTLRDLSRRNLGRLRIALLRQIGDLGAATASDDALRSHLAGR